ncbi:TPA: protease inhibitor I42 family protein, partial [Salmonella enterica subsp. enterica serovar Aberdeen]
KKKSNRQQGLKMKTYKILIAGLMMAASASVLASDKGIHLDGVQGKEVKLALDSSPTTGYSWMIKTLPKELIFVSSSYEQSEECKNGAVGCSGKEIFTFIAQKSGSDELKLIHGQPFDKSTWKENTVAVKIK